jgi:hypothetical protein
MLEYHGSPISDALVRDYQDDRVNSDFLKKEEESVLPAM